MKRISYLILLVVMLSPTAAFATFNDIGVGARPLGLGGAFVALADDSNAANYNAAGLGYIDEIHLGVTHAQRFNGLITYNSISGIIPFGRAGSIGASLGVLGEDSEIYREQTVRVSYGNALFKQLAIGANLKLFGTSFDETSEFVVENPYFVQTSNSAISLDVGVIGKPFQSLSLGVSAENLLPADMSISEAQTDSVPLNIRAGLVYSLESIAEMSAQGAAVSTLLKGSLVTFEVASRNSEIYIRTGAEVWLNKSIAVRGGYGIKNGSNSATTLNFGGSAKVPIGGTALQLDYGFQLLSGNFQDNTTQRFSLNLLF
ncbi:MAG: hypothetical protein OYL97_19095 [Candidatus Poribacteria bacterium]|nr:hypothetical protein [Candidatus Poribacteria bacterium]